MKRSTQTIDASGYILGKLATKVAVFLMGKYQVAYHPARDNGDIVVVENVNNIKLNKKKIEKKVFYTHSQHPGGLKEMSAKNIPVSKLLRQAVHNMLPKNKLRAKMIKRLTIK